VQLADVRPADAPYSPALQFVHDPAPGKLYSPAPHIDAVAFVLPAGHAYPALQFPEHAGDVSPAVDPNVPAGHGAVHAAVPRPDVAPYSPALQFVHNPAPDKLYVPAGHTDTVALVDPATHAYPALQLPLQLADVRPADAPYRPVGHIVHDPAPGKLYSPAPHIDAVAFVDPAGHAYPAMQFPLHTDVVSPCVAPNLPAGHKDVHDAEVKPEDEPYRPTGHGEHDPEPLVL